MPAAACAVYLAFWRGTLFQELSTLMADMALKSAGIAEARQLDIYGKPQAFAGGDRIPGLTQRCAAAHCGGGVEER